MGKPFGDLPVPRVAQSVPVSQRGQDAAGVPGAPPLLPARSDLTAWLHLAAAPALAAPRARHKCPSEKCRERKKIFREAGEGGKAGAAGGSHGAG